MTPASRGSFAQPISIAALIKLEEVELPERDHFAAEMEHMSDCVMRNKEPLTPGEEGLHDLKIITAVYKVPRPGKTVTL